MIQALYINNKHGSLVYHRDVVDTEKPLSANEQIIIASTLHGMAGIAAELAPRKAMSKDNGLPPNKDPQMIGALLEGKGVLCVEGEHARVVSFETLTGVRIFAVCDLNTTTQRCLQVLHSVYEAYANHVLKNPFADVDMPVRITSFDEEVDSILAS